MMNAGICVPEPGFLQELRDLCTKCGALFIFGELKTGAKLARGGACEYFRIKPDIICLAKSIGGGFPLAAFGARKELMDCIAHHKIFHAGTYNTNPGIMAAGTAVFREVFTLAAYEHVTRLNQRLIAGYEKVTGKTGLKAYCIGAGSNGAFMLYSKKIRNYRDWTAIDVDLWKQYWFAMNNRGVLAQDFWWDEQ
jgi:glutamate-1-semialdehyde 2,1-aminomutase